MTFLKRFFNHERYTTICTILALCLIIWIVSCDSKVSSIRNPAIKVNREQMQLELDNTLIMYESRFLKLDRIDKLKQLLIDNAAIVSQGGQFNPIGLLTSIAALLGIGATVDRVRSVKKKKLPPD